MARLTIRDLDDSVKEKLRIRAAKHGHSMEAEARLILRQAVDGITGAQFLRAMEANVGPALGVDLEPRSGLHAATLRISAKAHEARRMIVPDTIVISELMKPAPAAGVKRWFAGLTEEPAATTAVTLAELNPSAAR